MDEQDSVADKQQQAAYAVALRALGRREHCAAELRQKLRQRDYADAVIADVISRLQADGYLSEARFAEAFLRMRTGKGETPWLAAKKARQRGVDEAVLQDALQAFTADFDALAACAELLARRDPQGLYHDDERVWQRQARFLQNKGFDAATILRVLNEHDLNTHETNEKPEDAR
ncbi:MAG: regulatory protein RecX [Mariprofundaceae bacterium]|nr:regulatory protein RecX [Mariprofundaceae bacterium]